jgi:hypothetical protein
LTDLSKDIVPKLALPLVDIQEPHPLISLSMVVCLNNQDLNQLDRWLINSLQANSLVNKVVMVLLQLSPQVNTRISRWAMAVLPVLVVMAVVLSRLRMLNGVLQLRKASETVSEVIKDNNATLLGPSILGVIPLSTLHGFFWECGISTQDIIP